MNGDIVIPVVITVAVIALIAVLMTASRSYRNSVSLERAEREGRLGEEGLRHARQRADRDWVENSRPADTAPLSDVVDHTIADAWRSQPPQD
ncbi:MAG TPA: hypothetical protein VGL04_05575 [Sporichthyaceae bacterium]|jgi:hypothetical protein